MNERDIDRPSDGMGTRNEISTATRLCPGVGLLPLRPSIRHRLVSFWHSHCSLDSTPPASIAHRALLVACVRACVEFSSVQFHWTESDSGSWIRDQSSDSESTKKSCTFSRPSSNRAATHAASGPSRPVSRLAPLTRETRSPRLEGTADVQTWRACMCMRTHTYVCTAPIDRTQIH